MKILMEDLTGAPLNVSRNLAPGSFGEEIKLLEPVKIRLRLDRTGDKVFVKGSVETSVELACCRCLESFPFRVSEQVDLIYIPAEPPVEQNERLGRDDLKTVRYVEPVLDPDDDARQAIHLAVPFSPVCAEKCLGLCPACGRNLNRETCGCAPRAANPQFAKLKEILPPAERGRGKGKQERS